jgi:group I intron endonuclease
MTIGIYKLTNNENGKCYIGQSIDIERRFKQHEYNAFNKKGRDYGKPLYNAIRNFSIENFTFEILEVCKYAQLDEREIYYINKFISYKNGYNNTPGGRNVNFRKLKNKTRLTTDDVEQIRNLYAEGATIGEVYLHNYAQQISLDDFFEIWIGESYPLIHMDVYNEDNIDFHKNNDEIDYIPNHYIAKIAHAKIRGERMPFAYQEFSKFLNYDMFKLIWESTNEI